MTPNSVHKSFGFAFSGIAHAIRENRNFRLQTYVGIGTIVAGEILGITRFEMIVIFILALMVVSAEMINSSVEEMTDLITTEHSQEAKIAKDVAAGMVLLVSIGAAIIGLYIFLPYILRLI